MTATTATKRRKTKLDRDVLWHLVKTVLFTTPHASNNDMRNATSEKFDVELPAWLMNEARFVYTQKVSRGEFPPPGGHASVEQAQEVFMKLAAPDRAKFLDWAQFTLTTQKR